MENQKEIKINAYTRLKVLLDADKGGVIESLIQLNSNFSKLRNPIMRNLLARRVTIADACKVGKCKVADFLRCMQQIGFVIDEGSEEPLALKAACIDFSHETKVHELDARSFLEQSLDPLKDILQITNLMEIGERLKVINSFEPLPLIYLLADKGYLHHTDVVDEQLVVTWFEKTTAEKVAAEVPDEQADEQELFDRVFYQFPGNKIRYVDVRHLEMPQPMLQILDNVEHLNKDELLYVHHKKLPVYLLPELEKKGLLFVVNHKSATELDLLIYRS